jgi:hypothetical protein
MGSADKTGKTSQPAWRKTFRLQQPWTVGGIFTLAALITACGGGGGGSPSSGSTGGEQPQGNTEDSGASTGPALTLGNDSFYFKPELSMTQPGSLDHIAGGHRLSTAWNPNEANIALAPGMKVIFFGQAPNCDFPMQGPVDTFDDTRLTEVSRLTAIAAASPTSTVRWSPSGRSVHCNATAQSQSGNAAAFLAADVSQGGVGLLTSTGSDSADAPPFFGQFSAQGQDGSGNNAFLQGSVVGFRQNIDAASPLRPWLATNKLRVRSEQAVGSAKVDGGNGELVQAKQQIGLSFLNKRCFAETSGRPCQIQYILTTAIYRRGVSDWSRMNWFKKANMLYDPVQGGIPVVDGPLYSSGTATQDAQYGLSVWTSQGSATRHDTFASRTFDVTISFEQLLNALKLTAASATHQSPDQVTDEQMATLWGSGWQDTSQWVLLSSDIGQEIYNPDVAFRAELGGGFRELFVGPQ